MQKNKLAKGFDLPVPAQRTAVPEASARKFEKPAQKTIHSQLRGAETGMRLAVYVPIDVEQALRLKCFNDRRSISNAATEALRAWLGI